MNWKDESLSKIKLVNIIIFYGGYIHDRKKENFYGW